jgi:putative transposase
MSHYRRVRIQGGSYFFTVNLSDRRSTLLTDEHDLLKKSLQSIKRKHPFKLHGWVVLPDHLHCIWTLPAKDTDYPGRWREIKKAFTNACRNKYRTFPAQLWQPRFWEHTIRNQTDFKNHFDYIHFNPVKHGYVEQVKNWPYSSFHYFVKAGMYIENWGGDIKPISMPDAGERFNNDCR